MNKSSVTPTRHVTLGCGLARTKHNTLNNQSFKVAVPFNFLNYGVSWYLDTNAMQCTVVAMSVFLRVNFGDEVLVSHCPLLDN